MVGDEAFRSQEIVTNSAANIRRPGSGHGLLDKGLPRDPRMVPNLHTLIKFSLVTETGVQV